MQALNVQLDSLQQKKDVLPVQNKSKDSKSDITFTSLLESASRKDAGRPSSEEKSESVSSRASENEASSRKTTTSSKTDGAKPASKKADAPKNTPEEELDDQGTAAAAVLCSSAQDVVVPAVFASVSEAEGPAVPDDAADITVTLDVEDQTFALDDSAQMAFVSASEDKTAVETTENTEKSAVLELGSESSAEETAQDAQEVPLEPQIIDPSLATASAQSEPSSDSSKQSAENTAVAAVDDGEVSALGEERSSGRLAAESDANTKDDSAVRFTVRDERTQTSSEDESGASNGQSDGQQELASDKTFPAAAQNTAQDNAALVIADNASSNIMASNDQAAGAASSDYQHMLAQQIQNNAPEFLKAGNMVLRDGNSGTINMVLKPESLGNVKIRLDLTDKVINAQITVSSREAYEAFKESIASLKQTFEQNGFENASFNLNLAENSNAGAFAQQGQGGNDGSRELYAGRTYGDYAGTTEYDETQETVTTLKATNGGYGIDVVA